MSMRNFRHISKKVFTFKGISKGKECTFNVNSYKEEDAIEFAKTVLNIENIELLCWRYLW